MENPFVKIKKVKAGIEIKEEVSFEMIEVENNLSAEIKEGMEENDPLQIGRKENSGEIVQSKIVGLNKTRKNCKEDEEEIENIWLGPVEHEKDLSQAAVIKTHSLGDLPTIKAEEEETSQEVAFEFIPVIKSEPYSDDDSVSAEEDLHSNIKVIEPECIVEEQLNVSSRNPQIIGCGSHFSGFNDHHKHVESSLMMLDSSNFSNDKSCAASSNVEDFSDLIEGKLYKCDFCDYTTVWKQNLRRHLNVHNGGKPFKCTMCDHHTARKSDLNIHMRGHGDKPYSCTICGYSTSASFQLKRHMVVHTREKPYKCTICDYSSGKLCNFKTHMKTHTGDIQYTCTVCSYSSKQLNSLKRHMSLHKGEEPFKCKVCNYSSAREDNLKWHMSVHTGEKPYKCTVCKYSALYLNRLETHMRTHSI